MIPASYRRWTAGFRPAGVRVEGYKFRAGTMALLVGLMLGSLRKMAVPQRAGGRAL